MKQAKTIDEQIDILKERGLIIHDKEKAKEQLLDIGYYRLGFYLFPLEETYPNIRNRSHKYKENASFCHAISLYYFDNDLRTLLSYYLNRIEVSFRTYITYTVSNHYKSNPTWFIDPKCVKQQYIDEFNAKVYNTLRGGGNNPNGNPIIMRHHNNYINDRYAPAWKTLEFMTLGSIIKLYHSIKNNKLKDDISNHFGCRNKKVFNNYIETIRLLRNACAHGTCIYNIKLPLGIANGPAGKFIDDDRHNINGIIKIVHFIIGTISKNRQNDLSNRINTLLNNDNNKHIINTIKEITNLSIK